MRRQPITPHTVKASSRPGPPLPALNASLDTDDPVSDAIVEAMMQANQPYVIAAMERKIRPDMIVRGIERLFIKVAEADAAESGASRPRNSDLAARTGLTRQRVARIKTAEKAGRPESKKRPPHPLRVLEGWKTDTDFIDEHDIPRVLPLRGEISFDTLVKRYSQSLRPKAILRELVRIKAVRLTKEGRVEMLNRSEIDTARTAQSIKDSGEYARELVQTLMNKATNPDLPPFHRRVVGLVKAEEVGALIRDHSSAGSVLLSTFQQAMSHRTNAASPGARPQKAIKLSVHYFISESPVVVPVVAKMPPDGKESVREKKTKRR
jgi:hypothetical protein